MLRKLLEKLGVLRSFNPFDIIKQDHRKRGHDTDQKAVFISPSKVSQDKAFERQLASARSSHTWE